MKDIFKNSMKDQRVLIDDSQTVVVFKQSQEYDVFNFYFEKDGKKFFFKANSRYSLDVSELLSYALDREVDKDAVPVLPAVFKSNNKTYYGTISEDVTRNNKDDELINGSHILSIFENRNAEPEAGKRKERFNTIEHYKIALRFVVGKRNTLDKNFFFDLAKHMISGFVRADEDLHAHNIPIIVKSVGENKKLLTMGKLFDKSMSFLIKSHKVNLRDKFEFLTYEQKLQSVEQVLMLVGFPFQVNRSSYRQTSRQFISKEIAGLILKYPALEEYYNAYKNINVKKVLTNFKQENKYDFIKDSDIELADMVVKSSLKLLNQAIEFENNQNKGPMRFLKQTKDDSNLEF